MAASIDGCSPRSPAASTPFKTGSRSSSFSVARSATSGLAFLEDLSTLRNVAGDVCFVIGERRQPLSIADAKEVHSRLVERNLIVQRLRSEIGRALREKGSEVRVVEEAREELLLVLDAIETVHPLTDGQRLLRWALGLF